jgi:Ca-activated chloride channel family protein
MTLSWPWALAALLAVPVLLGYRWWTTRRRRREALLLPSVVLVRAALPARSSWRRRIPVGLLVAGVAVLGVGAARPQGSVLVPANASSIVLAMDVSGSMCSTDVDPNRLTVAQEAARSFIKAQRDGTRIGIVAFSGIAGLIVPPTTDREELLAAIDGLTTARGTAIGSAILASVDAIAEINPRVAPTGVDPGGANPREEGSQSEAPFGTPRSPGGSGGSGQPGAANPGEYEPDTIVVLTDGANSAGVDPVTAAGEAAQRRVRVFTIGFGTAEPGQMVCTAEQLGSDPRFGGRGGYGGGRGGWGRIQQIDEPVLRAVAELTGGEYYRAEDADQLGDVLLDVPKSIVTQKKDVELTVWFALAGAVLVGSATALSLWWNRPRGGAR